MKQRAHPQCIDGMKAIFRMIAIFLFLTFPSGSWGFEASSKDSSGAGIATLDTRGYSSHVELIADQLRTLDLQNRQPLEDDFLRLCHSSRNSQNRVEWTPEDGAYRFSFACFEEGVFDEGKNFNFILSSDQTQIMAIEENGLHLKQDSHLGPIAYLSQGTTIFATTEIAATLSSGLLFPGEVDKRKHSAGSALMASFFGALLFDHFHMSASRAAIWGAILSCSVGAAKEIADPYISYHGSKGDRDARDFAADVLGCAIGATGIYFVNRWIQSARP